MATTFETSEVFNEPADWLRENLIGNLNRENVPLRTHRQAVHLDEYLLVDQQRVQEILGFVAGYGGIFTLAYPHNFAHFRIRMRTLKPTATQVEVFMYSPIESPDEWNSDRERKELVKIADQLLEFCMIPASDRDVGAIGWIKKSLSKDKRKSGDER